jgi:hypothetical protein
VRDVTRYRRALVREQVGDKQRLDKLLQDAQITLSRVVGLARTPPSSVCATGG